MAPSKPPTPDNRYENSPYKAEFTKHDVSHKIGITASSMEYAISGAETAFKRITGLRALYGWKLIIGHVDSNYEPTEIQY